MNLVKMDCSQCTQALPPENDFATCRECNRGFHYECANLRETSWRKRSAEDKASWRCPFCKAKVEGAIERPPEREQGVTDILAFLKEERVKEKEEERRKQEKERERRRQELEEEREIRRQELEEVLGKSLSKIEESQNRLEQKLEAQMERKTTEVKTEFQNRTAELEDQMQRFQGRIEHLERDCSRLARTPVATTGHTITPPTYDGSTSWGMYKRQFEAAALSNGWSDVEKATALVIALRGPALELLQTVPVDQQRVYGTLVAALELRYGDQHRQQLYLAQLRSRLQKSGESLPEYEAEIRRLVYLAYPDAPDGFQDRLAAQHFVDGIRDQEIQKTLRLTTFLQSSQALVRALEIEAAFSTSRPKIRTVTIQGEEKHADQAAMEAFESKILDKIQQLLTKNGQGRNYNRSYECYRCGKKGHFARDCHVQIRSRSPSREWQRRQSAPTQQENSN